MKKIAIAIVFIITNTLNLSAQLGYIMTNTGQKENMYGYSKTDFTSNSMSYSNKDAKKLKFQAEDMKYAMYKDYDAKPELTLSIISKDDPKGYLHDVVCYSDKYIIVVAVKKIPSIKGWTIVSLVYDWNFNVVFQNYLPFPKAKDDERNTVISQLEPYLKDCSNVLKTMQYNAKNTVSFNYIYDGIHVIQCGTKNMDALIDAFLKSPAGKK